MYRSASSPNIRSLDVLKVQRWLLLVTEDTFVMDSGTSRDGDRAWGLLTAISRDLLKIRWPSDL